MSSLEYSTEHGGDDHDNGNGQASSQPKILTDEEKIDLMANSLKPEKDDTEQEMSETKLTNQVVEPMSRGDDKETETLEENAVRPGELKTTTKGVPDDVRNLTRDGSMNPLPEVTICCLCCTVCSGACAFLLCLPCLAVAMVWRCIV